jgi:uncharacterized membrane protein
MSIIVLLFILTLAGVFVYQKSQGNKNEIIVPISEDQHNKVVKVTLIGGIIALFIHSPLSALNKKIKEENANGWVVVEVMPAASGNVFISIFRVLLLVLTLLFYTTASGYYIVMERKK